MTLKYFHAYYDNTSNIYILCAYNNLERTPVSFGPGVFLFVTEENDQKNFKTYDEMISLLLSRGIDIAPPEQRSYAKSVYSMKGIIT